MDALPLSLQSLPSRVNRLYLAFSGGVDSVVLLHNLLRYRSDYQIVLWHINHGLQNEAADMEAFSRAEAQRAGLDIRVDLLGLDADSSNIEAVARQHRYRLFAEVLMKIIGTEFHENAVSNVLV